MSIKSKSAWIILVPMLALAGCAGTPPAQSRDDTSSETRPGEVVETDAAEPESAACEFTGADVTTTADNPAPPVVEVEVEDFPVTGVLPDEPAPNCVFTYTSAVVEGVRTSAFYIDQDAALVDTIVAALEAAGYVLNEADGIRVYENPAAAAGQQFVTVGEIDPALMLEHWGVGIPDGSTLIRVNAS